MVFFDFEKPLEELQEQINKLEEVGAKSGVDVSDKVLELRGKMEAKREDIYKNLTGWQRVQISRHPERPGRGSR